MGPGFVCWPTEATLVARLVGRVRNEKTPAEGISVIRPYTAQSPYTRRTPQCRCGRRPRVGDWSTLTAGTSGDERSLYGEPAALLRDTGRMRPFDAALL